MSKENTAVFIGHNECYGVTSEQIKEAIVSLIDKGVTDFLSGGQGGFDRLCGRCVYEVKKQYPNINNYLVIPYLSFNVYNSELFDSIIYPDDFETYHFKAAIPARNKFMVDNANYAICYVNHGWGGAAKTYERAKKKGLNICISTKLSSPSFLKLLSVLTCLIHNPIQQATSCPSLQGHCILKELLFLHIRGRPFL